MGLLSGKKTYIVAGIWFVLKLLGSFGVIPPEVVDDTTNMVLAPLGLAALRAGVSRKPQEALKNVTPALDPKPLKKVAEKLNADASPRLR